MKIVIKLSSNPIDDSEDRFELASMLQRVAQSFENGATDIEKLYSIDGNPIGAASMNEDIAIPWGRYFHMAIDETGNAAFEDNGKEWEVARIIRDAAEKIREGSDFDFVLRDMNGNTVGRVAEQKASPEPKKTKRAANNGPADGSPAP